MDNVDKMLDDILFKSGGLYTGYANSMYEWSIDENKWIISIEWIIANRIQKLNSILKSI